MNEYFEFKDGTFWAARSLGNQLFIKQGDINDCLDPECMVYDTDNNPRYHSVSIKTFSNEKEVESEGLQEANKKAKTALLKDALFWDEALFRNSLLLFFMPSELKTSELCMKDRKSVV
jgi:hypothetical protein